MDIRMKTIPFEFEGKTYTLCCNMNVLADVQEAFGGNLAEALDRKHTVRTVLAFLAAMLNDAADSAGWPERFTARELGRKLPATNQLELYTMVMDLVSNACADPDGDAGEDGDGEKNGMTRQGAESTLPGT